MLRVPLVHADQRSLRAVAGQVYGIGAGDVEQRDAQQRGRLLGGTAGAMPAPIASACRSSSQDSSARQHRAVRRQHALGVAGRAGGVEDRGRIFRRDRPPRASAPSPTPPSASASSGTTAVRGAQGAPRSPRRRDGPAQRASRSRRSWSASSTLAPQSPSAYSSSSGCHSAFIATAIAPIEVAAV